jgi:hypothetical protein
LELRFPFFKSAIWQGLHKLSKDQRHECEIPLINKHVKNRPWGKSFNGKTWRFIGWIMESQSIIGLRTQPLIFPFLMMIDFACVLQEKDLKDVMLNPLHPEAVRSG